MKENILFHRHHEKSRLWQTKEPINAFRFSTTKPIVAFAHDYSISLLTLPSFDKVCQPFKSSRAITNISISDKQLAYDKGSNNDEYLVIVAAACDDSSISIWTNLSSEEPLKLGGNSGHQAWINDLKLIFKDNDKIQIYSTGNDMTLIIWELLCTSDGRIDKNFEIFAIDLTSPGALISLHPQEPSILAVAEKYGFIKIIKEDTEISQEDDYNNGMIDDDNSIAFDTVSSHLIGSIPALRQGHEPVIVMTSFFRSTLIVLTSNCVLHVFSVSTVNLSLTYVKRQVLKTDSLILKCCVHPLEPQMITIAYIPQKLEHESKQLGLVSLLCFNLEKNISTFDKKLEIPCNLARSMSDMQWGLDDRLYMASSTHFFEVKP